MNNRKTIYRAVTLPPALLIGLLLAAGILSLLGMQAQPGRAAEGMYAPQPANKGAATAPLTLTAVTLDGPTFGPIGTDLVFTATVLPLTTTGGVTYRWEASGFTPLTNTGGVTDVVTFSWPVFGPQMVTVYAMNGHPPVSATLPVLVDPNYVYLPFISKPTTDLTIAGVEIVQTIQTPGNTVPLVAGRSAVVRVYPQSNRELSGFPVTISIAGTRHGAPLPGSPLQQTIATVPETVNRGDLASSVNIPLPYDWLFGPTSLEVTVDSENVIHEFNEGNNTTTVAGTYNDVPALDLMIVPVNYTHNPTGQYFPGPTDDNISDWILRTFPVHAVNVTIRSPMAFAGDMSASSEWNRLLNAVTSLKSSDGAPSAQVYYAFLPSSNASGESYPRAWGGIGWIGLRASVGVRYSNATSSGRLAAHEIGHNFGRYHAPCGGPSGVDPNYPYANASIGHYGLDTSNMTVWTPDSTKDLMSYCSPKWLSDYTYMGLYNNQLAAGAPAQDATTDLTLLFRAALPAGGEVEILPVYTLTDLPLTESQGADYSVELLSTEGQVLATYPVAAFASPYDEDPYRAINAVLPHPGRAISQIRLLQGGKVLAVRALEALPTDLQAQASFTRETTGELRLEWDPAAAPALVRFKETGSSTWTTLQLDLPKEVLSLDPALLSARAGILEVSWADGQEPVVWQMEVDLDEDSGQ